MTAYEQIEQLTEVITNLEKDITSTSDSLSTTSSKDLPVVEENLQYLRDLLKDLKLQKEQLISEL
jgi:septal ring factor EnvC (AmiA/AmiB activator)